MSNIKFISNKNIDAVFNVNDIVRVVQNTFTDLKNHSAYSPKKFSLTLPGNSTTCMKWINSMPAYLSNEKIAGIKWISVCSANGHYNLPTTNGVIILNNIETGMPIAICDASLITHYRSAASILLAAKFFASKQSKVATVIGPGGQGSYSMLFLNHEFNLEKINVVSRTNNSFIKFKKFIKKNCKNPVIIERTNNVRDAIDESDIVIVSSTSANHLLVESYFSNSIKKDQFICGLTAFNDISPSILNSIDNIIFDDGENAIKRIEEVSKIDFSLLNFKNLYNMITFETNTFNVNVGGRNLYLPIGISAMDIAIANYFYRNIFKEKSNHINIH